MTGRGQKDQRTILDQFFVLFCVIILFYFHFRQKTEIMRKQPRSSLLIWVSFLPSLPECYQVTYVSRRLTAFSITNNSIQGSAYLLDLQTASLTAFFFPQGKTNTSDIQKSNLKFFSRGNCYFPSKSANTLELRKCKELQKKKIK